MKLTSIDDLAVPGALALEGVAEDLNKLYDDFMDDFDDPSDYLREPGIHASELCACMRQTWYSLHDAPKQFNIDGFWRKRFMTGKAIHDMLQTHFEQMAALSNGRFTFEREVAVQGTPLAQELFLCSSMDGLFTFFEHKQPIVRIALELKSKSQPEYEKLKEPEPNHVKQVQMYMKCRDIPLVWFMYWDKGKSRYTPSKAPFLQRFNPQIWAEQEARARQVLADAQAQRLPPREEGLQCQWCAYSHICQPAALKNRPGNRRHLPINQR